MPDINDEIRKFVPIMFDKLVVELGLCSGYHIGH